MSLADGPGWRAEAGEVEAIVSARHTDPFAFLGAHETPAGTVIRAFVPGAETLEARTPDGELLAVLDRRHDDGVFEGLLKRRKRLPDYRLHAANAGGAWVVDDPYRFAPVLGEMDDFDQNTGVNLIAATGQSFGLTLDASVTCISGISDDEYSRHLLCRSFAGVGESIVDAHRSQCAAEHFANRASFDQ